MTKNGKNLTYLRASNQGEVLKTILLSGPSTRLELASKLNLTSMSISYITGELLDRGILSETKNNGTANTPGRHSSKLEIVPGSVTAIGVSVERCSVFFTLVDLLGEVIFSKEVPLSMHTTQQILTQLMFDNIQFILDNYPDSSILGIGVSNVGLVDTNRGIVFETTSFFDICDWPIGDILYGRFQIPTYIVEDMKASALAEQYYGTAKGFNDFVYLGITQGVGVGVISNGKLFEGHNGFAGEIGHTTLRHHGRKCSCGGEGCLETYVSVPALLKESGSESWNDFLEYCNSNPDNDILSTLAENLGISLVTLSNLFDPQAIIIGHEGATLNEEFYEKLQEYLSDHAITKRIRKTVVKCSSLAKRISYLSAPAVIFSRLFLGEFKF